MLVCASGMSYYPLASDATLTEAGPAGTRFLSQVQQAGEAATTPASAAGIRGVHLRMPPVLGGRALIYPDNQNKVVPTFSASDLYIR
jgi:NAD dependent epimerase/dehydratase family enzyme